MGLLDKADWTAKWIAGDYIPKKNQRYPVDHFKKEFVNAKPVAKARLYITACGLYTARINGRRVGDFVMAPGCTDYRKRLQYQAYDVTELLCGNRNAAHTLELELPVRCANGSLTRWRVFFLTVKIILLFLRFLAAA